MNFSSKTIEKNFIQTFAQKCAVYDGGASNCISLFICKYFAIGTEIRPSDL